MLVPTSENVKTITDMREKSLELLELVQNKGLAYIFYRSQPKAVVLSLEEFSRLQELVEDYLDELEVEKLVRERRGKGIPFAKIAQKYLGE